MRKLYIVLSFLSIFSVHNLVFGANQSILDELVGTVWKFQWEIESERFSEIFEIEDRVTIGTILYAFWKDGEPIKFFGYGISGHPQIDEVMYLIFYTDDVRNVQKWFAFTVTGTKADGYYYERDLDTEEYTELYPLTGTQIVSYGKAMPWIPLLLLDE